MIDVNLLRVAKYKQTFQRLQDVLLSAAEDGAITPQTKVVLRAYHKYFETHKAHECIDFEVFLPAFRRWHTHLTEEQLAAYTRIIANAIPDVKDESVRTSLEHDLYEIQMAQRIDNLYARFTQGDLTRPLAEELAQCLDTFKVNVGAKVATYIDDDIGDLLAADMNDTGISFRLSCLNASMKKLQPGTFGVIAARPDKGKTSFIASEITYMAPQLPDDQNVLWLNNEGPGRRIIPRLYQAALGKTVPELIAMGTDNIKKEYRKAVGRLDRIRVVDIHGFSTGHVEALIENNNTGIVVFDMIDHIHGFRAEARTDLALEEMYKWARERAVKHNVIALATSQISDSGDGLAYPPQGALKDSRTGKQGASDFQLMIGCLNDEGRRHARFISLVKNKFHRYGGPVDPRCEVVFNPTICRYEDLPLQVSYEGAKDG